MPVSRVMKTKHHSTMSAAFWYVLPLLPCVQSTIHFPVHNWIEGWVLLTDWRPYVIIEWPLLQAPTLLVGIHAPCGLMCEDVPVVACVSSWGHPGYQMTCQLIAVCLKILVKPTLTHECVFLYERRCYGVVYLGYRVHTGTLALSYKSCI